ncbi:MAG: hypothetical protein ABIQ86_15485 [Steroidobacteraceae bacterium]
MQRFTRFAFATVACLSGLLAPVLQVAAQNANFTQPVAELERLLRAEPLVIVQAEISRPKATGDITLKADVSFGGAPPLRVKLRKAEPGAETFNNVPRYDLAAYELQKLFLDPEDYVVPPTVLRMVPLAEFAKHSSNVSATFPGAPQVLAVVQYWLNDVKTIADVYDAEMFATDPVYARHIGQMNLFTYLIEHRDSNAGNFLIGRQKNGARVFSIDNGVAFASADSDRGELWKNLRVKQFPADAIERLRKVTPQVLTARLGVLAQWQLEKEHYVPVTPGANLGGVSGVRRKGDVVQMGLTRSEIAAVQRQLKNLLVQVDRGRITLAPVSR